MATSLTTNMELTLRWLYTNALDLSTPTDNVRLSFDDELTNGTGAIDTADKVWSDTRTLAATTETLDLAGGLTDAFGAALTFARIKMVFIHNTATTVGYNLTIGGGSNPFLMLADASDKYAIGPNGRFLIWEPSAAGKAVTASTGDLLLVDSGANSVTYKIIIVGSTA